MNSNADEQKVLKLSDLAPGQKLRARISRIELFGAYADVGAECEGLIHISKLGKQRIHRVQDVVQVGSELDAWVERIDQAATRLDLTLIPPILVKWGELKPGVTLRGKVTRLEPYGAFVDIGAERPGLVHVSEVGAGDSADPRDLLELGDEVEVSVLEVDRRKKQIRLSMKAALADLGEESGDEPLPTAMELALRQAMQASETDEQTPDPKKSGDAKRSRKQQEDLLARTLSQRVRTSPSDEV